ncbi:transcriptional regulator GlxA family with amidase domain [Nakamurella sp. UYEF19]|uniref:helix-turn-helix domain-containing protein n=1 Tax=Nakamurella sp. UYEF19 TaxID=1756392 RepID=UPI003391E704
MLSPHRVVVPLTAHVPIFEVAVACEVFGRPRRDFPVPWYEVVLCRGENGPVRTAEGLLLGEAPGLEELAKADTVIVPACVDLQGDPPPDLLEALRLAHARGARIASICTGAFTLAAAGLLDGRRATTHWMHGAELTRRWPNVLLDPNVLYTQDGQIFTSAGECAGLDLCLSLIRLDHGARFANALARRMVLPAHRDGGQAQYIDQPLHTGESTDLSPVLAWARSQLHRPLTLDDLAGGAAMSQRTFVRHFRARTGTTPLQWLMHERVSRAQELLETTDDTIERIATQCGFGSVQTLRTHFTRVARISPSRYRQSFRPSASPV